MSLIFYCAIVLFLLVGDGEVKALRLNVPLHLRLPNGNSVSVNVAAGPQPVNLHNWGSNFQFSTQNVQYPVSVAEVQQIVKNANKVRVLGTRHSFSKIADSDDTILSTLALKAILGLDPTVPSVTVQPGITYTDLAPFLQSVGFALPNLASLAEISVGGASQTGAHGSGLGNQCLAKQIRSLQLVTANGSLVTYGPNDPELKAVAVGLGAFGVITQVELYLQPTYNLTNYVFTNIPTESVYEHFNDIENMGYSVQFFTDFSNPNAWNEVWIYERSDAVNSTVESREDLYGAQRSHQQVSPIAALPATYVMTQGVEQPWYYGLVDYHLGLSGFDGSEIQTEYFLPYEHAVDAIKAVSNFSAQIAPRVYTMLIRTIAGDDLWLSEMNGGPTVAIHMTWINNFTALNQILPQIEQVLLPYGARPHWGKYFIMGPDKFLGNYPKLNDFVALANRLDPTHKFRNTFLNNNVFVNSSSGSGGGSGGGSGCGNVLCCLFGGAFCG